MRTKKNTSLLFCFLWLKLVFKYFFFNYKMKIQHYALVKEAIKH